MDQWFKYQSKSNCNSLYFHLSFQFILIFSTVVKPIRFEILKYKSFIFSSTNFKGVTLFFIANVENDPTIPWDLGSQQLSPSKIATEEISHKV